MTEPPDRKLHYDRYFYINRTKDGGLAYRGQSERAPALRPQARPGEQPLRSSGSWRAGDPAGICRAYRRNMEAINKALSRCGFFLIGETNFKKTTAEILEIYRRRDVVEKCFDNLKNDIDMRRLYVQSDEVAQGKMFVAFIALIVRSYMQNKLCEYMSGHKYTFQKILLELDKVKLIHSANHENNCRLLNLPTKTQREIMEQLGLAPDAFGCV